MAEKEEAGRAGPHDERGGVRRSSFDLGAALDMVWGEREGLVVAPISSAAPQTGSAAKMVNFEIPFLRNGVETDPRREMRNWLAHLGDDEEDNDARRGPEHEVTELHDLTVRSRPRIVVDRVGCLRAPVNYTDVFRSESGDADAECAVLAFHPTIAKAGLFDSKAKTALVSLTKIAIHLEQNRDARVSSTRIGFPPSLRSEIAASVRVFLRARGAEYQFFETLVERMLRKDRDPELERFFFLLHRIQQAFFYHSLCGGEETHAQLVTVPERFLRASGPSRDTTAGEYFQCVRSVPGHYIEADLLRQGFFRDCPAVLEVLLCGTVDKHLLVWERNSLQDAKSCGELRGHHATSWGRGGMARGGDGGGCKRAP